MTLHVVTCQLSAQEIVNWVTTADGCVHTADAIVLSRLRRRCVLDITALTIFRTDFGVKRSRSRCDNPFITPRADTIYDDETSSYNHLVSPMDWLSSLSSHIEFHWSDATCAERSAFAFRISQAAKCSMSRRCERSVYCGRSNWYPEFQVSINTSRTQTVFPN